MIAKKIAWSKSVYGDFIPSGLGDAGLDENLDLLSALTEAIAKPNGRAEKKTLQPTNLAGIERQALEHIPRVPEKALMPGEVCHALAPVKTLEEWLLFQGVAIGSPSPSRRRKAAASDAQMNLF